MNKHPALQALRDVIDIQDVENRRMEMMKWWREWVYCSENTQFLVNKSVMSSDQLDFAWEIVTQKCAQDLLENDIVDSDSTNNSLSVEIWALRNSKYAKLKKNTEDS